MSKIEVDEVVNQTGDNDSGIDLSTNDNIKFNIAGSQKAMIDSSGHLLVGKTSTGIGTVGAELKSSGELLATVSGDACAFLNRTGTDGVIVDFRNGGTNVGNIGIVATDYIFIGTTGGGDVGMAFIDEQVRPVNGGSGANADNLYDLGNSGVRWDDIHATNGTIQTSDQNEKQDIASATSKELNVAKKLSALFKTFRWKDKVVEKGDKARTHTGIIAQDIQSAFSAEGLDASNYGLFTSYTWTNEEGKEQTRLGVRYPELFSFIFSSIEARLTALEGA